MKFLRGKRLLLLLIGICVVSFAISFSILTSNRDLFSNQEEDVRQEFIDRARKVAESHRMADNLRIFTHALSPKNEAHIPVFVVEEHFEVLKHWFDAVKVGVIPESGNTLLHIDGHSDGGVPYDLSIVPQFRLPKNQAEVANMMQGNDVFVVGAALTGLIDRFIWVWPAWDFADHKNDSDHEVMEVRVGWRTFYPREGDPVDQLCACIRPKSQNKPTGSSPEWECWNHEEGSIEPDEGPIISSMDCTTKMSGLMEIVHEKKAVELIRAGGWITEKDHLILDVDEDYYGCESSVMPLYESGLTQNTIDTLSDVLNKLLCVENVQQEYQADNFFHVVIQSVLDLKIQECKSSNRDSHQTCLTDFGIDKSLIEKIPNFINALLSRKSDLPCSQDENSNKIWMQVILRTLENLNVSQLEALDYVGICLITAPTSFSFEKNSLHVCHGFNVPNQTLVTFHVPSDTENKKRTDLLQQILTHLPSQPSAVTVCRSVRDGYTPWRYFQYAENAIFSTLKEAFSRVKEESFHFDENLLGGKAGWPERHN